jgi:hypothetical protein
LISNKNAATVGADAAAMNVASAAAQRRRPALSPEISIILMKTLEDALVKGQSQCQLLSPSIGA